MNMQLPELLLASTQTLTIEASGSLIGGKEKCFSAPYQVVG
jgi:hypothetical protein